MLTKSYIDGSKRKPQERYIHLLSDALIYSTKLIGPYNYKVRPMLYDCSEIVRTG